ncbi:CBM_collapsed_G0006080.mRNA.1.CDS.1 [Saccharomyces cerevisiae]|nr:CBM_collapsed_G0006080.mRNA.1.CDS.1 [Saccharomyces cerevisiae]
MDNEVEKNIEIWKVKKLVQSLEKARGNGTSMISLVIPPKGQIPLYQKMLTDEYGTASNIKSRVNRLSVLSAITSTQQKLKLYNTLPKNGLVLYCGDIITEDGKEKKVTFDIEPYKPINTSLYLCDNKFHTEVLSELLQADDKFGFIVMDGQGTLFGSVSGNTRTVLHKFTVDLPKKHGRGGQSALRFALNVKGLILAGSADFKTDLAKSELFDPRLACKVISIVDVSYGGENGFNQAIELSAEALANVKYVQEKKLLEAYFDEISQDTGKFCYGIDDTLKALDLGAVEKLIVFENLETIRYTFKDAEDNEVIKFAEPEAKDKSFAIDKATGQEMDVVSEEPLIEWLAANYKNFGATLEFITDKSSEGAQFVTGFGGIGAMLRYKVNFEQLVDESEDEYYDEDEGSDYDFI